MKLEVPLRTDRLQLRTLRAGDANANYLGWMHDAQVQRYLESRFAEHTLESLAAFIAQMNESPANLLLGICLAHSGRHIGNIKLGPVEPRHGHASVGLLIGARDCWGQGYAGEAIAALTDHAFETIGLHKLYAGCYAVNVGSQRAFERCGWRVEGHQADHWTCDGERVDNTVLGITRRAWASRAGT